MGKIETFKTKLQGTEREGIEDLIAHMEAGGFFTAPCSGSYHLAKEGGLVEHSLNVCKYAEKLATSLGVTKQIGKNSIILSALLHDLGKMGQFDKPNYVENILKSGNQSGAKPYKTNPELLYVDHAIRSVAIAQMYIDLTEEEQHAILYHDGMYGGLKYSLQDHETPLQLIIHWADMWASHVIEKEDKKDE